MIDLHSHLLPGIDDGSPDLDETTRMLEAYRAQGVTQVAATSHAWCEASAYRKAYEAAREKAREFGIELLSGTEYTVATSGDSAGGALRTVAGGRTLLLDLETIWVDQGLGNRLSEYGQRLLLAHPERLWGEKMSVKNALLLSVRGGIVFQLNCGSFLGRYGKMTEKSAWKMLDAGFCSLIATDAHRATGVTLAKCRNLLSKYYPAEQIKAWFEDNPRQIINDGALRRVSPHLSITAKIRRYFTR